jgi:hypothetical protein
MSDERSNTHEQAEIGILFVHGIGQQQPGQTLLQVEEPLVEWIHHWLKDVDQAWPSDTGIDRIPEQYRKYRTGTRESNDLSS